MAAHISMANVQATGKAKAGMMARLEGLAVVSGAVALYSFQGFGWWMFALLLLLPDVAALGYLHSARAGNIAYNIAHTVVLPIGLAVVAVWSGNTLGLQLALIWLAHIGMDRAVGYNLKPIDAPMPVGHKKHTTQA